MQPALLNLSELGLTRFDRHIARFIGRCAILRQDPLRGIVMQRLAYQPGTLTPTELQREIGLAWAKAQEDPSLVASYGVDEAVAELPADSVYRTSQDSMGLDPISTAIIVEVVIPIVGLLLVEFFEQVLLPMIRARRGDDAIGRRKDDS